MLVPKCCKGCSGRKSGMCNCTLPSYCNEWVEDDETYPTNVGGVINTPSTTPDIVDQLIRDVNKKQKEYLDKVEQTLSDKDHRIAVLEKALRLMSKQLDFVYNEECCVYYDKIGGDADDASELMNDYIKEAEKELEGQE